MSLRERPFAAQLISAILRCSVGSLNRPRRVARFAKWWLRYPIEYSAAELIEDTPAVSFADLFPDYVLPDALPPLGPLEAHDWNVRLDEKIYIGLIVLALKAQRIFEIGTFDGGTTRYMAEAAGPQAQIFTLDLPPAQFDRTQNPSQFSGTQVGAKYRGTSIEKRVTQLLCDSTQFDFSPYAQSIDLVFVDASHDYEHGLPDSNNALRLVRPGGVVVWHDYSPCWPGLVRAIREATDDKGLVRLADTSLAVLKVASKPIASRESSLSVSSGASR